MTMVKGRIVLCIALLHPSKAWVPQPRVFLRPHASLFMTTDFDSLLDMDVILFERVSKETAEKEKKLELGAMQEDGTVAPLSAWSRDAAFGTSIEFLVDEEDRFPGLEKDDIEVIKILDESVVSYGSRQVGGGKGPGNPHGEESELLYYVEKDELENIEFAVKPELEILW